jgi:hypothetical protein
MDNIPENSDCDDWDIELDKLDINCIKNNFVNIQDQINLLENREMEEKADNVLMNDLFSENTFNIQSDKSINFIKNNGNNKLNDNNKNKSNNKNDNRIKNIKNPLSKNDINNHKIQNYYKQKIFNENKKNIENKMKNDKKILNIKKNDIFGDYEDDELDNYCSIEDKHIK